MILTDCASLPFYIGPLDDDGASYDGTLTMRRIIILLCQATRLRPVVQPIPGSVYLNMNQQASNVLIERVIFEREKDLAAIQSEHRHIYNTLL